LFAVTSFERIISVNGYIAIACSCNSEIGDRTIVEFNSLAMQTPINLIPSALGELFAEVNDTSYITLADRYGLMAAIFDDTLTEEDKRSIDRLLRAVCRGRIKLVNELSMVRAVQFKPKQLV